MPKFSVRKPLTVFVAVIAILVLGVVAFFKMTPDLLPNMDFPYMMIMTTYPGASPEKVESELTKPLEQSMSTLEHIKEVSSTSGENFSMVLLEFEESADLDTLSVDIQQRISALQAQWDELVSPPYVLKINPSLLPVEVAAVSMEGKSTAELTEFLHETLMNKLEGISGVARITASGLVDHQLHVVLDQKKIDQVNAAMAAAINRQIDDASKELTDKKTELEQSKLEMENAKAQLESGKASLTEQTAAGEAELGYQQGQLLSTKADLQGQISQLQAGKLQLQSTLQVIRTLQSGIRELESQIQSIQDTLNDLLDIQQSISNLEKLKKDFQDQIDKIQNDSSLTPEQIQAAIAKIKESPAYHQVEAEWKKLQAKLAAYGLDLETIQKEIAAKQQLLEQLSSQLRQLEQSLSQQGLDPDTISAKIQEMESNIAQMDQGIVSLTDAVRRLDDGMIQLKDAAALLSQQKAAGLLELSSAATELAVGNAGITAALTQIEGGLDAVESSRKEALSKADLSEILTMDTVNSILTAQNFSMPAGYVEQDGVKYMVSVGDEIRDEQTLENLLLFDPGIEGVNPVFLKDVAGVLLTDNRNETYARLNGSDSVVLNFEKQSTYATAETTDNIVHRFRQLEQENPGLQFVSLMNQGDYIYLIVRSIYKSLILGAVFAVVILFLFLHDLRPTVITLCSIPISVIFAIVLMYFSGVTINMISLSALAVAVGMLVDNSVVVIENIYRLRSKGANMLQAAVSGAAQVSGAIIASTLTTVCVFLPIVFVEGITRQLFTDLALTMTYSLMASLIVALTLVPAMASGMLRKEKTHKHGFMDHIISGYGKAAGWSLKHKSIVLTAALLLLIGTGIGCVVRGFIFMPEMDFSNITVTVTMPEDASMEESMALADQVLEKIDTVEGIETVGAMMNSGMMGGGTDHNVTIYLTLSDRGGKGSVVGKQIVELCRDMPCEVNYSASMMDMSMMTGSGISMEVYARDMESLESAARQAAEVVRGVDGVASVSDGLDEATPALHIRVDRNKAMGKGLTVAQIYMELARELKDSVTGGTLNLDGTSTQLIVDRPEKLTAQKLKDYRFEVTKQDGTVSDFTLGSVAEIEQTVSLNAITRLDQRRYVSVTAEVEPGYNVTLVNAQVERAMSRTDLGEGVSYEFAGENEMIMESIGQLVLMLVLGVLLVYLVMVAQFQSLVSPFIVMFTIPLAFTGGFLALLICGMELSVISLIGFIMLTGIIVNNGIVLVDYINQLRREGMERREAIILAGKTRMRPILMTSVTTILGLTDMALSRAMGTAMMQPVAVVCIGGLVYATLMTLFVVPCIYDVFCRKELRRVREEDLKLLDL